MFSLHMGERLNTKKFCKTIVNIPTYHPSQTCVTSHNCIPTINFLDRIAEK